MSIGFIGLGQMGGRVARRLLSQGYSLVGYDSNAAALEDLLAAGGKAAASPKDLASRSRYVLLSLPSSHEVEEICLGANGVVEGANAGTVVIDLTSGAPPDTVRIAQVLAERGIRMIDAAVGSGGGAAGALEGKLTIMAGGDDQVFSECLPILKTIGTNIFHVGPIGSGHLVKALNNFLAATTLLATSEAMVVATKAGLDPGTVLAAMQASSGRSYATERRFPMFVLKGDFGFASGGLLSLLVKDVRQAVGAGQTLEIPMFISSLIYELLSAGLAELGSNATSTDLVKMYERWAKVEVRENDTGKAIRHEHGIAQ
jgi:3-hydroxyisobutyrate dehydrogenase-like beta-hydroxyacid dehydrogenase